MTNPLRNLREYQVAAAEAWIAHARRSVESAVIEAATGAGKTHIISALAEWLTEASKKRVLVLAPRWKLVKQDAETHRERGGLCSVYCGSVNERCTARPIIYATPVSARNAMERGEMPVEGYAGLFLDDFDGLTPTCAEILTRISAANPQLRVLELTATPFVLGSGFVYSVAADGTALPENLAKDPPFIRCVAEIRAPELIERGALVPPVNLEHAAGYDTSGLKMAATNKFTAQSVRGAFLGKGRKTESILAEVLRNTAKSPGVIIFAATQEHAATEIMPCLPRNESACIISGGGKADISAWRAAGLRIAVTEAEREAVYDDADAGRLRYLVNVDTLTRGFDWPAIEDVVFLRATESRALFEQMLGRGLRLSPGKTECRIWDYAGNVERHCPDGELFSRDGIAAKIPSGDDVIFVPVECPTCRGKISARLLADLTPQECAPNGNRLDLAGYPVAVDERALPAIQTRRCPHTATRRSGDSWIVTRCEHRWNSKPCPDCDAENDISARKCGGCGAELVDPNDKLAMQAAKVKANAAMRAEVLAVNIRETVTQKDPRPMIIADVVTTDRRNLRFYVPSPKPGAERWIVEKHAANVAGLRGNPRAVRYKTDGAFLRLVRVEV
jgi:DNA repair protein RadD